jgi:hypothetical protein
MTYRSKDVNRIDAPMLSKLLWHINSYLRKKVKFCFIGGTALTLLNIRESGSEDIDILLIEESQEIVDALKDTLSDITKISIDVNGIKYPVPKNIHVHFFSNYELSLSEGLGRLKLPADTIAFMHRIKLLKWVMPENGSVIKIKAAKICPKMEIFTLGIYDLFCTKIFFPREKDKADVLMQLENLPLTMRLFSWRRNELLRRFKNFISANKDNPKLIDNGIKFYNYT